MKLTNDPPVIAAARNALGILGVDHEAMTDEEVLEATERALEAVHELGAVLANVIRTTAEALGSIAAQLHAAAEAADRAEYRR